MKKIVSLVLVLSLCFALCACGKSKAVAELEAKINTAYNMPTEYADEIDAAHAAVTEAYALYEALTDKEKAQVENYQLLESAYQNVFDAEYVLAFHLLQFLNISTEYVAFKTVEIGNNVGASDMYDCRSCVEDFTDETKTLSDYNQEYDFDMTDILWYAGYGLCPENVDGSYIVNEAAIIEECASFNLAFQNIIDGCEDLEVRLSKMRKEYGQTHAEQIAALNELWIESNLYAELAMAPEGSLGTFQDSIQNYSNSIDRLTKAVEILQ